MGNPKYKGGSESNLHAEKGSVLSDEIVFLEENDRSIIESTSPANNTAAIKLSVVDSAAIMPLASMSHGWSSLDEPRPNKEGIGWFRRVWQPFSEIIPSSCRFALKASIFVVFRDPNAEKEYGEGTVATYRFRAPVAGLYLACFTALVWAIYSPLLRTGKLVVLNPAFLLYFDLINGLCLISAALLTLSPRHSRWLRHLIPENPEVRFYILGVPVSATYVQCMNDDQMYAAWALWCMAAYIYSEFGTSIGLSHLKTIEAFQFKFWTDNLVLSVLMINLILYNQLMNTRSVYAVWMHGLSLALYISSRIILIFMFYDFLNENIIPGIALIETTQILVVSVFVPMAYLGRLYREVLERMAWYRMKQNRQRLHQLRTEQMKRKKGKSETLAETVLHSLKKAEIALTAAAFERSHHGSDPVLIEQQQKLRYCIEILLDREELFNIVPVLMKSIDTPKSVPPITDPKEVLEGTVVDMYNFDARFSTKSRVHSHETGQDLIMPPVAGPPGSIVPLRIRSSQYWHEDQLGVDPNTQLLRAYCEGDQVLLKTGIVLLDKSIKFLGVNTAIVEQYLQLIASRYPPNPYHNESHGAMVAHMAVLISNVLGISPRLAEREYTALVVAALCHDVGHPGFNNGFLVNCGSLLARVYNDTSVLENFHAFLLFRYSQSCPELNIFQNLPDIDYRAIRFLIIKLVLATDMAEHFATISKFRVRKESEKFDISRNTDDLHLVMQLTVKMADLSHALLSWDHHFDWTSRVVEEFYQQGDCEASLGMRISPLCDRREAGDLPKCQAGFLQFVITPLANVLAENDQSGYFTKDLFSQLVENRRRWESMVRIDYEFQTDEKRRDLADIYFYHALIIKKYEDALIDPLEI